MTLKGSKFRKIDLIFEFAMVKIGRVPFSMKFGEPLIFSIFGPFNPFLIPFLTLKGSKFQKKWPHFWFCHGQNRLCTNFHAIWRTFNFFQGLTCFRVQLGTVVLKGLTHLVNRLCNNNVLSNLMLHPRLHARNLVQFAVIFEVFRDDDVSIFPKWAHYTSYYTSIIHLVHISLIVKVPNSLILWTH